MGNITVRQLGDGTLFENDAVKTFIETSPYHSFVLLCNMLEFLARCSNNMDSKKWEDSGKKQIVDNYISQSNALKKYSELIDDTGNPLSLYKELRCGMLHTLTPGKLSLTNNCNDISNKVIGANELYEDLNAAWQEIKGNGSSNNFLDTDILTVNQQ